MPTSNATQDDDLLVARLNLSMFVESQASQLRRAKRFGWEFREGAPETFEGLLAAYELSISSGEPFPISPLNCDNTVFVSKHANGAMRFWHDCAHGETRLTFGIDDELELANHHLDVMEASFSTRSLPYRLLHADTIGQTECLAVAGIYPRNQLVFDVDCLNWGVPVAIESELRRLTRVDEVPVGS